MRLAAVLLTLLVGVLPVLGGPGGAVAAAASDARALTEANARHTRYLSLDAIPEADRAEWRLLLSFHTNSLSRAPLLAPPRVVGDTLLAIDVRDYQDPEDRAKGDSFGVAFEKLFRDPYYHALVETKRDGRKVRKFVLAPWLPTEEVAELARLTESRVPVVDARFFFAQSAIQAARKGTGYYDFLGLKKRADFERLTGLDVKEARRLYRETAAILRRSGVSENNRQIYRLGAVDSGYWKTLDTFDNSVRGRNAVVQLNGDFVHDAEEHYGVLPNRLFGYYLSDKDGVQQDTAPDKIGPDTTSTSNRGRIDVMLGCVRCHATKGGEGLAAIKDYGRHLYRDAGPFRLQSTDYRKLQRLRQLYLTALQRHYDRDNLEFSLTLRELTGWTPKQLAAAYRRAWKEFVDEDVTLERAALDLGCTPFHLRQALRVSLKNTGKINPVLAAFADDPPGGALRDQWEESYAEAQAVIRGYAPLEENHP